MKRTDPFPRVALSVAVLAAALAAAAAPRAQAQAVKSPAAAVPSAAAATLNPAAKIPSATPSAAPTADPAKRPPATAVKAAQPADPVAVKITPSGVSRGAMFDARDVLQERFVLVAAPIGKGERAQLNIYEQVSSRRPCFATAGATPAQVEPLLGTFDFTGICNRYIDGNGYSLRVGGSDLGTVYRLSVVRQANDTLLVALPTKNNPGPEMVVARSGGPGSGFLLLVPEPGWKLMRRHFGNRALGHVYVYRDAWPSEALTQQPLEPPTLPALPSS